MTNAAPDAEPANDKTMVATVSGYSSALRTGQDFDCFRYEFNNC